MKRILSSFIAVLFLVTPAFAETSDSGTVILPVIDSSYKGHPVVSLLAGSYSKDSLSNSLVGVELSLDCPLLQVSSGNIRQQISYANVAVTGATVSLIELNPHWMNEVADNLTVGIGPGLGISQTSVTGGSSESKFSIGIGVSAAYKMDSLQLGAEYISMDGSRVAMKAGFAF